MAKYSEKLQGLLDEVRRVEEQLAAMDAALAERAGASGATGATPGRQAILALLNEQAPLTVPEMAKALGNSRQYTQRTINALKAGGLVEQQANPRHKTSVCWRLSQMGVHAVQDWRRSEQAMLAEVSSPLKKKQLQAATDVLVVVREALEKRFS